MRHSRSWNFLKEPWPDEVGWQDTRSSSDLSKGAQVGERPDFNKAALFGELMVKKLDHISIVVSDLERAKAFFTQFGFSVKDEARLAGEWLSALIGLENVHARYAQLSSLASTTNLELIQYISPPSERDPQMSKANQIGFRHIAFEVDNIDEVVQALKSKGIEFLSPIQTYGKTGKKIVYLLGPDGIILELAQYTFP